MIKLAVFKPFNAKKGNAFFAGQHSVFKYLQSHFGYQVTYFAEQAEAGSFDGVTVKPLRKNAFITFMLWLLRRVFLPIKYYWKIPYYGAVDFSGYDVVVTEGIHYLLLEYLKFSAKKTILNDSISSSVAMPPAKMRFLKKYFDGAKVVTVNGKIPGIYQTYGLHLQTEVIGHAVDVENIPFAVRKQSAGKLVSVGRLTEEKGFEYIIKALVEVKKSYPQISLDIYGSGPLEQNLLKLIHSLHLDGVVQLKGSLDHTALINALQNYDLFVSHPLEISYIAEAFSMANMEAMASGLPVISTVCGGIPYVVADKAVLVEQKNVGRMAKAITEFLQSPALVEQYSIEGRQYIEQQYAVPVIAAKWHALISKSL